MDQADQLRKLVSKHTKVRKVSRVITVMADGEYSENADVNEDGTVDVADISRVITVMTGFE